MAEVARVFRIHGRVQGVGFRWWARSVAGRLGLHGTVRNLGDGSVELVASGAPNAIDELRRCLSDGPPGSRVDRLEESTIHREHRKGFHIVE
jgi:acylphosphatase